MSNSAAVIGTPTNSIVVEDTSSQVLTAQGTISISDANPGQAAFKTSVISANGNLGTLTIASNGSYTYSVADSAVQYLGSGDTKTDSFTVTSVDGTTKKVSFLIEGVNDAAVIGNPTVHDVTEDASKPTLTATGTISISDADQGEASFQTSVIAASGNLGSLKLAANGSYTYSVADSAVQYLGAGDTKIDSFTVTSVDGTTKQVAFTIHGVNDAAVIGTPTVHDVTEDATSPMLTAIGSISIFDADQNQAAFKTTVVSASGNLGALTLAANGSYTYSVADSAAQYLGAGDTKVDTFTVTAVDGTSKQVSFTIHGINDAAVIGTPAVADVTEDATQPLLYAIGSISISDADQGQAFFKPGVLSAAGNLGTLILLPNGSYAYFVADSAVQYLGAGDTKVDTFTVSSVDGTTKQVFFTIHGANDAAVIGNPTVHDVTEDKSNPYLTAVGTISISDVDQGQAAFKTTVVSAGGNLGTLTLAANGSYTYSVADSLVQYLGTGDTKIDTFTVTSLDGTAKQVAFTIHGVNDAAVIGTPTVNEVTADPSQTTLTAIGSISIFDADQNQSAFKTTIGSAAGNLGHLTLAANGSYTYTVAESLAAQLGTGGSKVDTFTVTSLDGTTKQVTFTVHGPAATTNHPATIGDPTVSDVTEDVAVTSGNLTAAGTIPISDPDAGQAAFQTTVTAAQGNLGSLSLGSNGSYTYSVSNSAVQYLGASDTKVDSFTVKSVDGTTKVVSFTIHGTNDAASIGAPSVADVTEDANPTTLTAIGSIAISDADQNQAQFQTSVTPAQGTLGTLTLGANGSYTYSVAESAVQYLGVNDTKVETFSIKSIDGTTAQVSFTIHGTNDAASIGTPTVSDVTEDANPTTLTATGAISISDADQNQAQFQTSVTPAQGTLGTLTLGADGSYTYSVADSAVQYLGANDTKVETFSIKSIDGTTAQVSFTIHGTNDAASIGTPTVHDVTEDANQGTLTAPGTISINDADQNQSTFQTAVTAAQGDLGTLTLGTNGSYTYSVADSAVQYLGAGDTKIDTFTIKSADGTTAQVSFTIHGAQDAPTLAVNDATGADDANIPLSIAVAAVDNSGTLAVQVQGVPTSYTLNHGTLLDDGSTWLVSPSDLGTLALVPVNGIASPGPFTLHVVAASVEGGNQLASSADITINVTASVLEAHGQVIDGYIAGATVFADANGNGILDAGEAHATTNADGSFTLVGGSGPLVMFGGTDISTGLSFQGVLKAPEGSTVVTPLTTLITALIKPATVDTPAVTAADAAQQISSAFGLDPSVDLTKFDPVSQAASSSDPAAVAVATAVLSAAIQVQSTVTQIAAAGGSPDAALGAIADAVASSATASTTIDLSSSSTVHDIVASSGVSDQAAATVEAVVAAANDSIHSATDLTSLAQAGQVAQGAAATQLAQTNFNDPNQVEALHQTYVTDLSTQVSNAQVGAVNPAILGTIGNDVLIGTAGNDSIDGLDGNDQINGGDGSDYLFGGAGNDRLTGGAGSDHLDGGVGFDRAIYTDAASGIVANLAAGTVTTGADTDILTNIEGVVGSNFADTFDGTGFTGVSGVPGTPIGFSEFEGGGGNDTVIGGVNALGAALTRVSYVSATAGVTVDLATGTADGDASVGHDTLVGPILAVWGSNFDDTISGTNNGFGTVEVFSGFAGNDLIDGRGGFDRADYNNDPTTVSGITVHLAAGTVTGDASVGTDTLRSVEAIRGTNFADVYDATGFGGTSTNAGSFGTFNEFTGNGGNDTIIGNGNTRISFNNATAGVTVDIQAGNADGDASVGHDTFTGVNAVQGSMFADTLRGSAANETFTGNGGDDFIDGRGGFDVASYNNIYLSTGGITINMAAGIVTGDSSIGTDTLRSIEGIQGTNNADTYDATGYGIAGALNVGNNGNFNQFEGLGGDDIITGNGNTRVIYANAAAGVTVDLSNHTAHGTAAGDAAKIGTDTIVSGVNSVTGSAFGDVLIGDGNSNTFVGGGGNDTIDGGGSGDIAIFSGASAGYTINFNTPGAGQVQVVDKTAGRDGTDTLTNVEVLQFTDVNLLIASGSPGSPVDLSDNRLFFSAPANALSAATGSNNDFVKVGFSLNGHQINLGAGNDTVILGQTGGYTLGLVNVENVAGTNGNDFLTLSNTVNGLSVDLGGGTDNLNLASGFNAISVNNVENIFGTDFSGSSDDTLTLLNNVSGVSVNLANGNNTLNLAAGANSLVDVFNIGHINGSSSNDTLTITHGIGMPNGTPVIDLGAGDNTLNLNNQSANLTLLNVEHLAINAQNSFVSLANDVTGLSVSFGDSNSTLALANGANAISVLTAGHINGSDFGGTNPSDDTLTLLNDVSGVSVNLGDGNNILNLAAGSNTIANAYNIQTINGTASNDSLTFQNQVSATIDLGAGTDTLTLGNGFNFVTVKNIETVIGGSGFDNIVIAGSVSPTTVTGGLGADTITASNGPDIIHFTSAADSSTGQGDQVINFDAAQDRFSFDGMSGGPDGFTGQIVYVGTNAFDGTAGSHISEARLVDFGGGNGILQIDVNGDGLMDARDVEINLTNFHGTLSNADFVVPDQAPTDIILAGNTVAENSANGTVVGLLSAVDPDTGDIASFSLTDNAGGLFAINGNQLVVAGPLDYETAASQHVTVRVTDSGGLTYDKPFTIGVTNVNEAPTAITLTGGTVAENSPNGTVVGTLSSLDPDAGDSATFSLTSNPGNLFAISGNQLVVNGPLDYETAASQQITVRVTDSGGLTYDKQFTIGVTNVNEAPTAIMLTNSTVAENSANGTVIGALSALDPDAGDSATFTLFSNPGGLFAISAGNQLVVSGVLDYETATSHQITVRVTDAGGLTYDKQFIIGVTNVDEAPTDIALSASVVPQSSSVGTVVGALSATDPDAGDTATFSLTDNDGGQFSVSGNNLVVNGPLTAGPQQVTVRVTDSGGLTFDKVFTIAVNAGATITGTAGADTLTGAAGDDTISGLAGNDRLQGLAGNDTLDGGPGFDRAVYSDATAGLTFNLASGTVNGTAAGVGTDTLVSIEGIVGTDFADTYDPTGFTGSSGVPGAPDGLNEFEGRGGNDTIIGSVNSQGALLTRISYVSATGAVTVDLQAGTATGDASVGTDTLIGSFSNVFGSAYADTLLGSSNASGTVEVFDGRAGNDFIDGRGGFDRADYNNDPATSSGITVNMAAGTVNGDSTIGMDTLRSVEAIRGTNFADTYNAVGFSGTSTNAGSNGTFNEFTGNGGDDIITGNGNTRISFSNATGGVIVNIATGHADGDLSVGHDTFTGVNAVMGSMFNDTITGSNGNETFTGLAGDDFTDGGNGFDTAVYNNIYFTTGGITVNFGAGTVTGDASIGNDTLRSIEGVQGTNFADTFNASTFGTASALNIGNNGTFNQFEGLGGNDTIIGNGNTRIIYSNATGGVTIHLAAGTATGDASVGTDTFSAVNSATGSQFADTYDATGFTDSGTFSSGTFNLFEGLGGNDSITGNGNTRIAFSQATAGVTVNLSTGTATGNASVGTDTFTGVNSVQGSGSADTLTGDSRSNTFIGNAGNDIIDGGAGGDIAVYNGPRSAYNITFNAGQIQVADITPTRDGTDTLTNIEVLQFSNVNLLVASGSAGSPVDISDSTLFFGPQSSAITSFTGSADDFVMIGFNMFGHQIDLGAGNDTVLLGPSGFYSLNLANVENVTGSSGDDSVTLTQNASGLSIDLGGGNDNLNLAGGANSINVNHVENIFSTDFTGSSDDTLALLNDVSGVSVNLANGNNTLNLAAGVNSLVDVFNIGHVNGSALDDTLTITDGIFAQNGTVIDLGAGDDTVNINTSGTTVGLLNVEHLVSDGHDSYITLTNDVTGLSVDLGAGNDTIALANGANSISVTNVENISGSDFGGSNPSDDTLTLLNDVNGITINLGDGNNTLDLAAGSNTLANIFGIQTVNGSAIDDTLTFQNQINGVSIDLAGGNNTLNLADGFNSVTVNNVQTVNGGAGNDTITIANTSGSTTVTGGHGVDFITASAGQDNFNFVSTSDSAAGQGDTIANFDASHDAFTFTGMNGAGGFASAIHFVGAGSFDGGGQSEAHLAVNGGQTTLQIDVDGDGQMTSADMEIQLINMTGALTDGNFLLR